MRFAWLLVASCIAPLYVFSCMLFMPPTLSRLTCDHVRRTGGACLCDALSDCLPTSAIPQSRRLPLRNAADAVCGYSGVGHPSWDSPQGGHLAQKHGSRHARDDMTNDSMLMMNGYSLLRPAQTL